MTEEKKMKKITVKVVINISKLLAERNMSMRQLALATDIRVTTISELANNRRENINFFHLVKIASELGITDIREIISFEEVDEEELPEYPKIKNYKPRGIKNTDKK